MSILGEHFAGLIQSNSMNKPKDKFLGPVKVERNWLTKPCASRSSEEIVTDIDLTHVRLVAGEMQKFSEISYAKPSNVLHDEFRQVEVERRVNTEVEHKSHRHVRRQPQRWRVADAYYIRWAQDRASAFAPMVEGQGLRGAHNFAVGKGYSLPTRFLPHSLTR